MKKLLVIWICLCGIGTFQVSACSMYKLTKNGKTIVGNNEDWTSPNGQFWFEAGSKDSFGVMYMGFLNNFTQGAINQAGLVFDGFWEPYLEVKNTEGKTNLPIGKALSHVMKTMTNVEEVQAYLQTINLSILDNGQLVFVDQKGSYLIIEGDEMFLGNENEKSFSNFYYSQIDSIEQVDLQYFQKGQSYINETEMECSLNYCSKAMSEYSQSNFAPTQYTTVYDLKTLTVRIYLFHDYSQYVEINLNEKLKEGNQRIMIAELFPKNSKGYIFYKKYNNPEHPTQLMEEFLEGKDVTEQDLLDSDYDNVINGLGYEWLYDIKNAEGAIKVFKYGVKLMPNSANLYDSLGESYYVNKDYQEALENYSKSLTLNPDNENAKAMMVKIKDIQKMNATN
ncbi:MAG: tetratricopeptide repeat protein [Salibacteraceae bacterium]